MPIYFERITRDFESTPKGTYEDANRCICGKCVIPVVPLDEAVKAQEIGILEARIAQDTARLKQLRESNPCQS